jgi:hypothetical protein
VSPRLDIRMPDCLEPMFMIVSRLGSSAATGLTFHRVSVVKSNKALTIRPMQRQRIIESVRFRLAHSHPANNEPDPKPGLRINDQDLPVQIKQSVQGQVANHSFIIITN